MMNTPTDQQQESAKRHKAAERMYHAWDEALAHLEELPSEQLDEGVEGLLALYAKDAVIESPLIPHLMKIERGICHGHHEMRPFFREVGQRKPSLRKYYRTGYFTNGKKLMWEYPRAKPDDEQMDFVEVMELNDDGLIQHHSVYWGWYGVNVILNDAYRR